jgi:uncharacterized protein (DUF1697 family)
MPRHVVLLRGINVGPNNRLSMPALREALAGAGFTDVETYVQSGNIVLRYAASPAGLAADIERLLAERFALEVPVVTRTHQELAAVVERNPFPGAADQTPKHYQVTFLSEEPAPEVLERLAALAVDGEQFSAHGRELYAVHLVGIQGSKLANALTPKKLGVRCATARNWTTVTALLEMASDGE